MKDIKTFRLYYKNAKTLSLKPCPESCPEFISGLFQDKFLLLFLGVVLLCVTLGLLCDLRLTSFALILKKFFFRNFF